MPDMEMNGAQRRWRHSFLKEFFPALLRRESYDLRRNSFAWFGLLWGLPIPIMAFGLALYSARQTLGYESLRDELLQHPIIHIAFFLHPFVFAAVFGAVGVVYKRSNEQIQLLIDSLHRHVEDLNEANKQLRELDKLKDEFIANITHELRTPLVTIRGYTEMLLNGRMGEITPKQRRSFELMERNVHRLLSLIEDLLTLSRIDRKLVLSERRPFELHELFKQLDANFKPTAEKLGVQLQWILHDSSAKVVGLRDRLEQVFSNLLSNALKFTPRGGRVIVTTSDATPGRISVEVSDTGCGIPEEDIPRIFDRFVQADGSIRRRHGGAGLGLAIVREILDAHDCPISVRSQIGKGTTFRFDLPKLSIPNRIDAY